MILILKQPLEFHNRVEMKSFFWGGILFSNIYKKLYRNIVQHTVPVSKLITDYGSIYSTCMVELC